MRRSTERFLVTHVGSLPRPDDIVQMVTVEGRETADPEARRSAVKTAVADIVEQQVAHGIDVVNDGEMGKESYATYVRERLAGLDGEGEQSVAHYDVAEFPGFAAKLKRSASRCSS